MVVNLQQCQIGNEGKVVMQDVNLQVMPGEFCYLTGKSGAGKSTLLKTLYGEYPLVSGYADVVGFDLTQLPVVNEVLHSVGLIGLNDRKAFSLSGGEQQRLCIARAILNTPELIIADEPTGNLDPQSSDDVFQLFQQINQDFGTATIFATHDSRLINDYPARIIDCDEGTLIEI